MLYLCTSRLHYCSCFSLNLAYDGNYFAIKDDRLRIWCAGGVGVMRGNATTTDIQLEKKRVRGVMRANLTTSQMICGGGEGSIARPLTPP